ncbi:GNAT family N-acetyltransferase [Nocardioides sp. NPDC051685]|uniref:GNAT family N-acetyltransferase n=1 Tax=Nocardioides sp. NPDC051685 TaxID=3364334 RepID=UPI00378DAFCD
MPTRTWSPAHLRDATHVVPILAQAALGERESFTITGVDHPTRDGKGVRDYLHVWDLAKAHVRAVEKFDSVLETTGETSTYINIGAGDGVTVREMIAAVERVVGRPIPTDEAPSRPGDAVGAFANADKALELLAASGHRLLRDCRDTPTLGRVAADLVPVEAATAAPESRMRPEPLPWMINAVNETDAGWFAEKPTLVGSTLVLRPFAEGDVETMARILADPEVLRLTGSVHSADESEAGTGVPDEHLREWYATRNQQPDRLDLVIVDQATEAVVGEAVINEVDTGNRSASFRILIGPAGRDRGLGTEATRLIVDHAFHTTVLNRIELCVYAFNPRARRTYEKVGFSVEGIQREALRYDGGYVDAVVMSRLRSEHLGG